MTLPEVVKLIREKKRWNQRDMAAAMGLDDQQRISEMENAGPTWVKHWNIFIKLVPLCKALGIDPAQELSTKALAGGLIHDAVGKTSKVDQLREKAGSKK